MNIGTSSFLQMKARECPTVSLEERLILEEYIGRLNRTIYEDRTAVQSLWQSSLRDSPVLYVLKNVLLRYDLPLKWRTFVQRLIDRKEEGNKVRNDLDYKIKKLLPETTDPLPDNHPLKHVMQKVKEDIAFDLRDKREDVEDFLSEFDSVLFVAAVRDWLLISIGEVVNGIGSNKEYE
ncbi:MAG: hypothetical protein IPM66_22300 [Acidobacteriota bacterium]|nr:MAG: hypothetical protein IPM66_22300 [Acidobacteriota bacterium]